MEDKCFTMLCRFLPHFNTNHHRYTYAPASWTSLSSPTPSHPSRLSHNTRFELPASYSKFPLAIYFTYDNIYVCMLHSICLTLSFPHHVQKSVLYVYVSVAAQQIGSSDPTFSVQFNSVKSLSRGLQHTSPPCPSPIPGVYSNSCPLVGEAIQPSHSPSTPSPISNLSQYQGLFKWVSSSHQVAKMLEFSFSISPSKEYSGLISLDGLVRFPCSPSDSQESSPTAQFKSIHSSALSFL